MTYEYICTECHHEWEQEQSISEAAIKCCPKCGEQSARRQISGGAGFILKGGGWYADGYGSKPASQGGDKGDKADKADKSGKADTSKSDASKTDTSKAQSETKSTGSTSKSEASSKAKASD